MTKPLRVKQNFSVAVLRADPVIALGTTRVDMTPVFSAPTSLLNVAGRMRSQPSLVEVVTEDVQVLEVEQGLIVRQFLTYRTKLGACSNPARRALLLQSGARCFTRLNDQTRAAAFANLSDPHYIADTTKRSQALAASRAAAVEQADIVGELTKFRTMLRDPAQRAQMEAQIGASEVVRLAALSNEQLGNELVNASEVQIEEVMFVPSGYKQTIVPKVPGFNIIPLKMKKPPEKVDMEKSLQQQIFLTGFTLGQEYEWRQRVSVSVKWCVLGCKRTYFAEVYAGFNYGFGLRLPIKTGGLYAYHRVNGKETATIAPVFEPINGTESDYAKSGLPHNKLMKGKELVAEFNSYAGMAYKVPVLGSGGVRFNFGKDFTTGLPTPFTDGQFRPPSVGDSNPPTAEVTFDDVDLIGGMGNYGVAGAKVFPAVKVSLNSDKLTLKLTDNVSGAETVMSNSGQTYPVSINAEDHSSDFSVGNPKYNLNFKVTPGLTARLFIDVAVWSNNWDWPVWFPQVAVTLPPGGATFTCHDNTVCSRDYHYSPNVTIESAGEVALPNGSVEKEVQMWRNAFVKKWRPKCLYEKIKVCEVSIDGLATTRGNGMINEAKSAGARDWGLRRLKVREIINKGMLASDKTASRVILESKVRDIERYGNSLTKLYEPVWSQNCADQLCKNRIHDITKRFIKALINRQKTLPQKDRNEVLFLVNQEGRWSVKAKQEVEASQARLNESALRLNKLRRKNNVMRVRRIKPKDIVKVKPLKPKEQ